MHKEVPHMTTRMMTALQKSNLLADKDQAKASQRTEGAKGNSSYYQLGI